MPHRPLSLHALDGSVAVQGIRERITALLEREEGARLEFPPEVIAAAEDAAVRVEQAHALADREDLRALPFVTLDPASSTDLDQAMLLERDGEGYRVRYAIADVPFFVDLDGAIDAEARLRGTTLYLPDRRIPLHPEVLSEGAASLLPDQDAPALVWDLRLDTEARVTGASLTAAVIRSREKLAYEAVQEDLDRGQGHPMMRLLAEIGRLRAALETERGGASLNVPELEVRLEDERLRLSWRRPAPIEDANAQISLMTGMAAAELMIAGGAGILRTMPPAAAEDIKRFRDATRALGVPWEESLPYGQYLRTLDWQDPTHLALLNQATSLFRGAAYTAFTSADEVPDDPSQAAIAAPYAHATAPLRRLVDRFVLLTCLHHSRGEQLPEPLRAALPLLPDIMSATGSRNGRLEREAQDIVEQAALATYAGAHLQGTVIEVRAGTPAKDGNRRAPDRIEVQFTEPPVVAWVQGAADLGTEVVVEIQEGTSSGDGPGLMLLGPVGVEA